MKGIAVNAQIINLQKL